MSTPHLYNSGVNAGPTRQGAQKSLEEIEIDLENMKSTRSVDDIK